MNIKRLTARIWPVVAVTAADASDNDPNKNGERSHPQHIAVAEQYSRAGGLLAEMASQPLPPSIAAQLPAGTKVTISEAGREASRLDAQNFDDIPSGPTRLYQGIARFGR